MQSVLIRLVVVLFACSILPGCATSRGMTGDTADRPAVLIYGASGRIGSAIVDEALLRGYAVSGVTRDASRLSRYESQLTVVESDILDKRATAELVPHYDAVIVSVGGPPQSTNPQHYIAATAARTLVDLFDTADYNGPRIVFVGNVYTLQNEQGKTPLELGRAGPEHRNFEMLHAHQIALDAFRQSRYLPWTVASPPNGFRLQGRTGSVRWGTDRILQDADGTTSSISLQDFAWAIFEELDQRHYVRRRFTVAR